MKEECLGVFEELRVAGILGLVEVTGAQVLLAGQEVGFCSAGSGQFCAWDLPQWIVTSRKIRVRHRGDLAGEVLADLGSKPGGQQELLKAPFF